MFHCHGYDLLERILTPFFWHNLSGISSPLKTTTKNMPGKQPLHKFISHQLETPKSPAILWPSKKMVLVSYVFPRHAQETLELNQILRGFLATVFPCSRKKKIAKTQGARKGVDHLQEILGNWKRRPGGLDGWLESCSCWFFWGWRRIMSFIYIYNIPIWIEKV